MMADTAEANKLGECHQYYFVVMKISRPKERKTLFFCTCNGDMLWLRATTKFTKNSGDMGSV